MTLIIFTAFVGGFGAATVIVFSVLAWALWTGRLDIRITERPSIVLVGDEQCRSL
jgi:hypothetical protein